jgi:hypothetical protein
MVNLNGKNQWVFKDLFIYNKEMEINNHPNYLIYPDGRVQNKKTQKFLKLKKNKDIYQFYNLNQKNKRVHRLVAEHYISNPNNYPQVDHINRIRDDNRVENLRWVTCSENQLNKDKNINNNSGYKNIYIKKDRGYTYYCYEKKIKGIKYKKHFRNKIDCLCYKYIMNLKLKSK